MSYLDRLPRCPTCGHVLRTRDGRAVCQTCDTEER